MLLVSDDEERRCGSVLAEEFLCDNEEKGFSTDLDSLFFNGGEFRNYNG